ncbi:Bifunctional dihydroflavonol 4-reductase/flavanone 4-reductase [Glycine soja]
MGSASESVCVTGASGFIGSWLVMRLIERGYTVRATVRDPVNMKKVKHLVELPGAKSKLSLWKADLAEEGSFDEAIKGCTGVFHVATPMDFESKDPENEVIKPTINGVLDIMKACLKAKTVRRLIFTSSAGTLNVIERQKPVFDDTCWSDVEFCRRVKMTGWMYFVSKTLAEKEAWKFAKEQGLDFITIIPPLVVGPFLMPTMPPSLITALSPITGNEDHYSIIKQGQFVHLDDLCLAHIFLFEEPEVEGRFKNIPDQLELVRFSSKKITDLGFKFKYSLEDMYTGAIDTCRDKGLLPKPAEKGLFTKPAETPGVCYFTTKCLPEERVPAKRDAWRDLTGRWDRGGSDGLPGATTSGGLSGTTSSGGAPGATTSGSLSGASTSGGPRHATTSGRAWAPPLLVAPRRPPLVVSPVKPPLPPLSHRPVKSRHVSRSGGTRPSANMKKVKHLVELPGAKSKLSLWKADLAQERSFDEAIEGCTGVFHVATPMDFECNGPELELWTLRSTQTLSWKRIVGVMLISAEGFKNIPDELDIIKFSSKKITYLSFKFKYSLEDMFTGAVETCREKGLLPKPEETTVNGLLPKPPETTVNGTMQK